MALTPQERHRSFLLRLWRAGNGNSPEWRFSVEDVQTGERHGFADPARLLAFLQQQLTEASRFYDEKGGSLDERH